MDKKLIGIIITSIAMVAGLIYLILGYFFGMWHTGWIVFVVAGIAMAIVAMIGAYTYNKKNDSSENKDS